jgi:hypothetical protein
MRRPHLKLAAAAACGCWLMILTSCGGTQVDVPEEPMIEASLSDVSVDQWANLASRRIFFGHQSVGRNILAGVAEILKERPDLGIRVVHTDAPAAVPGAALMESNLGNNGDPASKSDQFATALAGPPNGAAEIALYKFCYLDVTPATNVDAMFDDYATRMRGLKQRYPGLTLVHVTLPLTTVEPAAKRLLKRLSGRTTAVDLNAKRKRFNDRLVAELGTRDPVFDLARLQSTRRDGSRSSIQQKGQTVYTLAAEWTDDGGHLNEAGQRRIAEQFLVFLARVADQKAVPATAGAGQLARATGRN